VSEADQEVYEEFNSMYQQIIIVGNVGRDPELRYTQSSIAVCDFSVAVNRRVRDENAPNGRRDETTWFRVTAWRQLAETVAQYVKKGRQVMVIGEVKASAYTDKAGQPAATLEITASDVRFLGSREEGGSDSGEHSGGGYQDDDFTPRGNRGGNRGGGGGGGGRNNSGGDIDDIPF
jgi:single-strand DNA-binding protein